MLDPYADAEDESFYNTLEEAVMTKCHLCGTPLEWDLKLKWTDKFERHYIYGVAQSCGITFHIVPELDSIGSVNGYLIRHE